MKHARTPQTKKELSYKKDHRGNVAFPKGFRRARAQANQRERRRVRQLLAAFTAPHTHEQRFDVPLKPVRRAVVRKIGAHPLRMWIRERIRIRVYRTAWNHFKQPYQATRHQTRFITFLTHITQQHSAYAREMALLFAELLQPPDPISHPTYTACADRRSVWLHAFLGDVPDWEPRLRAWIIRSQAAATGHEHDTNEWRAAEPTDTSLPPEAME